MNIVDKLPSCEVIDIEYDLLLFTGKNVPSSVFHHAHRTVTWQMQKF